MRIKSKRSLTLLEVLIAMTLVVLCMAPLIHPHVAIYRTYRTFSKKIEEDQLVNLVYGAINVRLYEQRFPFENLVEGVTLPIDSALLKAVEYQEEKPIEGTFFLKIDESKENEKKGIGAYLLSVSITLAGRSPRNFVVFLTRQFPPVQEAL